MKHPYIKYLEERRDLFKVLAEGAGFLFPVMAKALREKRDREIIELLRNQGAKK